MFASTEKPLEELMHRSFDSLLSSPRERFGAFHDAACEAFVAASSFDRSQNKFVAELQTSKVGALEMSRQKASPHYWVRSERHVRQDCQDDFLLTIVLEGSAVVDHKGRTVHQKPNELLIYDTGRPFTYELDADLLLIKVPRKTILARFSDIDNLIAVPLDRDRRLVTVAVDLAKQSMELAASPGTGSAASYLAASFIDLVCALVERQCHEHSDLTPRTLNQLDKIKRYALGNLGDEDLSIESMVRHGAVSRRTLNRLFAKDGTTPMHWVWARRLDASYNALKNGEANSVTGAAFQFGFKDVSHFSRTFKRTYGICPETLLR